MRITKKQHKILQWVFIISACITSLYGGRYTMRRELLNNDTQCSIVEDNGSSVDGYCIEK